MEKIQLLPAVGYPDGPNRHLPCLAFIILPVHNQAKELPRLVAEILRRSPKCCHVVLVEDQSTDGTLLVAYALRTMYAPRLHIARQPAL
jgi:hypothetical protein